MAWDGTDRRNDNTRDLVVETHTRLTALCDFIMDNGQPGAISKLNTRVDGVENRIATVETTWTAAHGWIRGIIWVLGGILGFAGTAVALYEVFKG